MTDEQIRTAIAVLNAYAAGDIQLDNDMLQELEDAIVAAFNAGLPSDIDDYPTDDPGFDPRFLM